MRACTRKMTPDELAARNRRIAALREEGLEAKVIAQRMGIGANQVTAVLRSLGLKTASPAYLSQTEMRNDKVGLPAKVWSNPALRKPEPDGYVPADMLARAKAGK